MSVIESANGGKPRLIALDIFRGVALLFMVLIHNLFTWTPLSLRQWPGPWAVGDIYLGMAAPLFFAATGGASYLSLYRQFQLAGASSSQLVMRVSSRSAMLYAIGIAFEQVWHAPPYDVTFFAELNIIAVFGLLAMVLARYNVGVRSLGLLASAMSSLFFVFRYVYRLVPIAYGSYAVVPYWSETPILSFEVSNPLSKLGVEFSYSFAMWGAYALIGMILVRLFSYRQLHSRLVLVSLGLMAGAYLIETIAGAPFQKWPMSLSYFFLSTGVTILIFFACCLAAGWKYQTLANSVGAVGRSTLPVYFGHYLLIFLAEVAGIAELARSSRIDGVAVLAIVGTISSLFVGIALLTDRNRNPHPIERTRSSQRRHCFVAMIVSASLVAYVLIASLPNLALGQISDGYFFLAIGAALTSLWYVTYVAIGFASWPKAILRPRSPHRRTKLSHSSSP